MHLIILSPLGDLPLMYSIPVVPRSMSPISSSLSQSNQLVGILLVLGQETMQDAQAPAEALT